jgi:transposase-like protein
VTQPTVKARMLKAAKDDTLAFYAFPPEHWRKIKSTNPLERFNRGIGMRTDVVGIFSDDRSRSGWPPCWPSSRSMSGWSAAAT